MKKLQRGFTLIELLVVIAVLAVLAAGVITAINPAKRIKQANDAKIKNDVGQIATGMQSYFTSSQYQEYPTSVQLLVDSGDLKVKPTAPGGADYIVTPTLTNCGDSLPNTACEVAVSATLNDPKPGSTNVWCWQSVTGKACEAATCPVTAVACVL